jgi:hypothetical protein
MNRMLDLWKEIPDLIDDDSNEAAAKSSARGVNFTDFSFVFLVLFCSLSFYFGS